MTRVAVTASGIHCRKEGTATTWDLIGREQRDELHVALTYRCRSCGRIRVQYGDREGCVTDAEAMAVAALEEWERRKGRDHGLDREDMVGFLSAELWSLYLSFDGRGRFAGYGWTFVRRRLPDYIAKQLGAPERRKPHADAHHYDADPTGRGLERALGRGAVDDRTDSGPDLLGGVLASRRRGIAEQDRKLGASPPARSPARAA